MEKELPFKYIANLINGNTIELSNETGHMDVPDILVSKGIYYRLKNIKSTNDHEFTCDYIQSSILILD